jgi:hypothetical protein
VVAIIESKTDFTLKRRLLADFHPVPETSRLFFSSVRQEDTVEEIIGAVFAGLFEILGSIFVEGFLDGLFALLTRGFRGVRFRIGGSRGGAVAMAIVLGGILGGLSVLVLPTHLLVHPAQRVVSLLAGPMVAGAGLLLWDRYIVGRRDGAAIPHSFLYGFLFAFCFGLARFLLAQ